jgi:hypothetical protein
LQVLEQLSGQSPVFSKGKFFRAGLCFVPQSNGGSADVFCVVQRGTLCVRSASGVTRRSRAT